MTNGSLTIAVIFLVVVIPCGIAGFVSTMNAIHKKRPNPINLNLASNRPHGG